MHAAFFNGYILLVCNGRVKRTKSRFMQNLSERRQWSVVSGQVSVASGRSSVVGRLSSVVSRPPSIVHRPSSPLASW